MQSYKLIFSRLVSVDIGFFNCYYKTIKELETIPETIPVTVPEGIAYFLRDNE